MNIDFDWLLSAQAKEIFREVGVFSDPLVAAGRLRKRFPDVKPQHISQLLTQATLRRTLLERTGISGDHLILTQSGLEQATHPIISHFRAQWLTRRYGESLNIIDLTCGLGFDSMALAQAGHRVTAYEQDALVANCAEHNLKDSGVKVVCADSTQETFPSDVDVFFADPARRNNSNVRKIDGTAQRIYDPEQWSPSWSFLHSLPAPVVAKVAPGIPEEPLGTWDAQWISLNGSLVETMVNSDGSSQRTAVLINSNTEQTRIIKGGTSTPATALGEFLIVPDAALIRARALNYWVDHARAGLVNEHIAWLTTNDLESALRISQQDPSPGKVLRILQHSTLNTRDLGQAIRKIPCSGLTIMTRGISVNVEQLRKSLLSRTDKNAPELVLALYRDEPKNVALLCQRVTSPE